MKELTDLGITGPDSPTIHQIPLRAGGERERVCRALAPQHRERVFPEFPLPSFTSSVNTCQVPVGLGYQSMKKCTCNSAWAQTGGELGSQSTHCGPMHKSRKISGENRDMR